MIGRLIDWFRGRKGGPNRAQRRREYALARGKGGFGWRVRAWKRGMQRAGRGAEIRG